MVNADGRNKRRPRFHAHRAARPASGPGAGHPTGSYPAPHPPPFNPPPRALHQDAGADLTYATVSRRCAAADQMRARAPGTCLLAVTAAGWRTPPIRADLTEGSIGAHPVRHPAPPGCPFAVACRLPTRGPDYAAAARLAEVVTRAGRGRATRPYSPTTTWSLPPAPPTASPILAEGEVRGIWPHL